MIGGISRFAFMSAALAIGLTLLSSRALAEQKWAACKPVEAATFPERIHVKCETAVDGKFWYFAASTTDPRFAARALSVLEAAQLGDKFVSVLFDPADQTGATFGCAVNDCRRLVAVIMTENHPGKCDIDSTQRGCPGFCAANGNSDRSCPGFCAAHPDDRGCPAYCATHDDMQCPGNCTRHPANPRCDAHSDECLNQHLPGCRDH